MSESNWGKFWIVYRVDVVSAESFKQHSSYESAKTEAERLCNKTMGIFAVLEAMDICKMKNIEWCKLTVKGE